jgi:hypothetical protein
MDNTRYRAFQERPNDLVFMLVSWLPMALSHP